MRRPLLFLCVCLFVLIALGMQITNSPPWSSTVAVSTGDRVFIVGQVYEKEYRVNYGKETIIFYLKLIDYSKEAETSNQEIFQKLYNKTSQYITKIICEVNISDLPRWGKEDIYLPNLGECIVFSGQWQEFSHATNPGEFDLANYYAIEGIGGKVKLERLISTNQEQWYIRETIFRIRQRLIKNLYDAFAQEDAAILAKMLLGDGSGLNKEVRNLYQNNGIVHILSISGLHISMLGMGIYTLLRKGSCPIGVAAVFGGVSIVFYGVLTGFGVSSCRAIGMYLIRMLGEIWGKTYDMLTAMGVLAILLVAENPKLVYHSGYLLSFTSVCGVGLLAPILPQIPHSLTARPYDASYKKWLKNHFDRIWRGFTVSLAVTLFTLPAQLFFFYKIPVYSIFINLLVIPFVGVVMIIGFVVMLIPGLWFLCPIESLIFTWFEWLCVMFEKLPGHTWLTGRPQMWKVLIYYAALLGLICLSKHLKCIVKISVLSGLVLFVGVRFHRENLITFLDVGQGDCICVQTVSGECYLFDGGSSNKQNVGEQIILPYLQYCGISHVDAIFVSHPDEDHTNGLRILLAGGSNASAEEDRTKRREVTVERLILPAVADAQVEFAKVLELTTEDIVVEYVSRGDTMMRPVPWWEIVRKYVTGGKNTVEADEFRITCLHPGQGYTGDTNAYSACYLLEMEGTRILLTGDVEGPGETALAQGLRQYGIGHMDILKVAHHGSRYSTTQEFLDAVEVGAAIISSGRNSLYGHPHEETMDRLEEEGCNVYITAQCGAVVVKLAERVEISNWMSP